MAIFSHLLGKDEREETHDPKGGWDDEILEEIHHLIGVAKEIDVELVDDSIQEIVRNDRSQHNHQNGDHRPNENPAEIANPFPGTRPLRLFEDLNRYHPSNYRRGEEKLKHFSCYERKTNPLFHKFEKARKYSNMKRR